MVKESQPTHPKRTNRGRESVEKLLISSACRLLSEKGPKSLSIRDIGQHAGVNHGQIHHYFGSKNNLLKAAIRKLADDHHQHHKELVLDGEFIPPPLSLSKDQDYIMAIVRCVIDGEMELATLELDDGESVPRNIMVRLAENLSKGKTPIEVKSALMISMAIEWGWAALAPYFLQVLEVDDAEIQEVQDAVGNAARSHIENIRNS